MSRVPQIWTNTDKEGKGTTYLPVVDADGKLYTSPLSHEEGPNNTVLTWTSGNLTKIVDTYSDKTVTTDLTWTSGNLTEIDVTEV